MQNSEQPGGSKGLSAYFWRGLLLMIAPAITIWLIGLIYSILHDWLGPVVSLFVRLLVPRSWLGPFSNGDVPGLFLVAAMLFLVLIGWVASGRLGKKVLQGILDTVFERLPGVRTVYSAIRTMVESIADPKKREFKKAVWIPAFGNGKALVLVTRESVDEVTGKKLLTIWWPHAPNPMSGMILTFPEDDVVDSGFDYSQAMEIYVSLGVKLPLSLRLAQAAARSILPLLPEPTTKTPPTDAPQS